MAKKLSFKNEQNRQQIVEINNKYEGQGLLK